MSKRACADFDPDVPTTLKEPARARDATYETLREVCAGILDNIRTGYDGIEERKRECAGLYILFTELYSGIGDLTREGRELSEETVRSLDDYIKALCEALDQVYALDPGLLVSNEEHRKLIAMRRALKIDTDKSAAGTVPSQTASALLHEMLVAMYDLLSAIPADVLISMRQLKK
ncbi:hypothetical protein E8E12_000143 [Didymella heteroderae]|uniref:Uncharacterized protein n=1 Tax=Didymella heteroderae TaxID=1769908 RepID=A0A9P5BTU5_9PLEO|nr:hypothetical protein E8E12_000143 [Didymella heteroderae]